jgi:hypothetical protein
MKYVDHDDFAATVIAATVMAVVGCSLCPAPAL